ncbi:hypothetical protein EDC47_101278 [Raoultella planticola]|nr:hypothetical protein BI322_02725 [Klebsiella oxytoca]TCL52294.1 hypothetical protein EDC47_101278 [Raoultella planticola]VTM86388.1 Uncharacterised protein [Raoultella ornithinolytica]
MVNCPDKILGVYMTYKRDRYLLLAHCGVYMVRIVIPSYMKPYFNCKRYNMKSIATKDIRQARLFRESIRLVNTRHCFVRVLL